MALLGQRFCSLFLQGIIVLWTIVSSLLSSTYISTEYAGIVDLHGLTKNGRADQGSNTSTRRQEFRGDYHPKPLSPNPSLLERTTVLDSNVKNETGHENHTTPRASTNQRLPVKIPFPVFIPSLPKRYVSDL